MADRDRKTDEQLEREAEQARHRPDETSPTDRGPPGSAGGPTNMQGAPAGGSAVGGLAGTNLGDGGPSDAEADLEESTGSGRFDVELEEQDEPPYSGHAGGAVGGAPAGKRAQGGRTEDGIAVDQPHRGDSTIGANPPPNKPR